MLKAIAAPPRAHPGYISGQFYSTYEGPLSAGAGVADTLYVYPFVLAEGAQVSGLFVKVTTAGTGSAVKLALWANGATSKRPAGLPLLANNAGVATVSGASAASLAVGPALLPAGVYWVGAVHTGTPPSCIVIANSAGFGNARAGATTAANAILAGGFALTALSTAQPYANDIGALNLTGATWANVTTSIAAIIGFGVA